MALSSPAVLGYLPTVMAAEFERGIFKTTKFLPGHEADVRPDSLILIRTDAEFAPASVLLPIRNEYNQWRFGMPGIHIPPASLNWRETLIKIPHEGFYRMRKEFTFGDQGRYVPNTLVQLGYTKDADPILFIAQRRNPQTANNLFFSEKGVKISLEQAAELLEPLVWFQEPPKEQESSSS